MQTLIYLFSRTICGKVSHIDRHGCNKTDVHGKPNEHNVNRECKVCESFKAPIDPRYIQHTVSKQFIIFCFVYFNLNIL